MSSPTVVFAEIEKLKESPPEASEVADVQREFHLRTFETRLRRATAWWMSSIVGYKYQRGDDIARRFTRPTKRIDRCA